VSGGGGHLVICNVCGKKPNPVDSGPFSTKEAALPRLPEAYYWIDIKNLQNCDGGNPYRKAQKSRH
jgi:hypothetical protein